jgi:ABC-type multidrug transport system permease subunit
MSIRRTLAIARKEFYHILRDLRTLFLVTLSPAFLLLILSYIFAFDLTQVDLAVWDVDESALSRRYMSSLTADGDFRIRERVSSYAELDELLLRAEVDGAVIVPPGFETQVRAGQQAQVQLVMDGSDPIASSQAAFDLQQRTAAFANDMQQEQPTSFQGLDLHTEARYNPELKSLISMVPGLIAVVLSMPSLALALALAREKETGSYESLITTPIRAPEYLLGKLSAYLISGLISVLLVWLVAVLYFHVPFRGYLSLYVLLATLYLIASMGFSLFISNFVRNQQTAMFLILMIFFVPSFFVAGLISPIDTRSLLSLSISYALPTTHFITISRGVFLKGLGAIALRDSVLFLFGMGLAGLVTSILFFRKRVV